MRAIVVGNGPIKKGTGKFIDEFDIVIRLNDFKLEGFEDIAGTKTDVWVPGSCKYPYGFDGKPECDIWALYPYHSRSELVALIPSEIAKRIVPLSTWTMKTLQDKMGMGMFIGGMFTTTGLSALEYAVEVFGEVWYTGFTWECDHYYEKVETKASNVRHHNYLAERMYIINHKNMHALN